MAVIWKRIADCILENSVYMNKLRRFFDILLLAVNSVGIAGSCIEVLKIPWSTAWGDDGSPSYHFGSNISMAWKMDSDAALNRVVFWAGLLLFCVTAVVIWRKGSRKRTLLCAAVSVMAYALLAFLFRKELGCGLSLALQNAVGRWNAYYQLHIPWPDSIRMMEEAGWLWEHKTLLVTGSVLFAWFPLEMLAGYCWYRDRFFGLVTGHILWFAMACSLDNFPDIRILAICVLGLMAAIVQKDFEAVPLAGVWAAGVSAVLTGGIMGIAYFYCLPMLDEKYAQIAAEREQFYKVVNEEWIPGLKSVFSDVGTGTGVDVTGTLNRTSIFSQTSADAYSVTVDNIPQGILYLKGFVGGIYGKTAWEAQRDYYLESYYKKNHLELPENYGVLVNISYEAAGNQRQDGIGTGHITIEELGGRGSYSIYPYGALLTEDFQVHGDGSVARKSGLYEFRYRFPAEAGEFRALTGQWDKIERQYRQYVYDNFLAYPEEQLPLLTEWLEQENIRTDNEYLCALDIAKLLGRQAVYNLDAGKNPANTDFVEYFLFESHQGYCVHFASAGVLALRYFGIPARYVTGYVVSPSDFSENPQGDYTAVLTGKQAHAWAEIYLDQAGWMPVEMTPGTAAFPAGLSAWQNEEWDMTAQGEEQSVLPGERPVQGTPSAEPEEGTLNQSSGTESENNEDLTEPEKKQENSKFIEGIGTVGGKDQGESCFRRERGPWLTAVGIGILSAILFLLGKYLYDRGKRRWRSSLERAGTGEGIGLLYGNLRKALDIAGCSKRLAVRGEEFRRKFLDSAPWADELEYEAFCAILEKNAFGRTEPSLEELQMVRELHDKLVNRVYEKAPFYKRLLFPVRRCYV